MQGSHEELTQWSDFHARQYDAAVGRWFGVDPQNQFASPYTGMGNNPVNGIDPDGEFFGTVFTAVGDLLKTAFLDGGLDPTSSSARRDAWRGYDPTRTGTPTNNAFKIDMGLFKTDENRTIAGNLWLLFSRFTWELPQTLAGNSFSHVRNLTGGVDNVDYYGGATLVNNDRSPSGGGTRRWGLTLGPYINGQNLEADPFTDELFRHEYGHVLQSRLIGPLYLSHVGLPSFIGSGLEDLGINDHNREWYETQANRMSLRYFENNEPDALVRDPVTRRGRLWNLNRYPTEYDPNWYWLFSHPPLPFAWWLLF